MIKVTEGQVEFSIGEPLDAVAKAIFNGHHVTKEDALKAWKFISDIKNDRIVVAVDQSSCWDGTAVIVGIKDSYGKDLRTMPPIGVCYWSQSIDVIDADEKGPALKLYGEWETSCGELYPAEVFDEIKVKFCPSCGERVASSRDERYPD